MAGLYIHVPFCKQKCGYCDFYSVPVNETGMPEYIACLLKEIGMRAGDLLSDDSIRSVYFGGGTPSLLSIGHIRSILQQIRQTYSIAADPEISVEVNPGAVHEKTLDAYQEQGFNRISVGAQSFHDHELRLLGRIHSARMAVNFIRHLKDAGWQNIGIDLIYGLPDQTMADWTSTLEMAVALNPAHISAYVLSWSRKTRIGRRIMNGNLPEPDEDMISDMYLFTHEFLDRMDYEHYEISNFARSGFRCAHNEAYWTGADYLGFGPSAHSFCRKKRFWNVADMKQYNSVLSHNQLPVAGEEFLTEEQQNLETLTLGLRRKEGLSVSVCGDRKRLQELTDQGLVMINKNRFSLTARGFLLADELAVYLTS